MPSYKAINRTVMLISPLTILTHSYGCVGNNLNKLWPDEPMGSSFSHVYEKHFKLTAQKCQGLRLLMRLNLLLKDVLLNHSLKMHVVMAL